MKRIIAILLAIIMVISLGACGKQKPTGAGSFDDSDDYQYTFSDAVTSATSKESSSSKVESPSSKVESPSKNETGSSSTMPETNPSSTTSSAPTIDIPVYEDPRIKIACWGDSITEGMSMHSKRYPSVLQKLVGNSYVVYNGGDGGEKTLAIAARQGGVKVYTAKKITFDRGSDKKAISTETSDIFVTKDGTPIVLTSLLGNGISVSPVKINGVEYQLKFDYFNWSPRSFKLYLYRYSDTNKTLTIPEGSEVVFGGSDLSTKGGIDIYMMGANGGYNNSDAEYINQLKAMIAHHGNGKYLIIKPYWDNIGGLDDEFGDHVVDFPKLAVEKGLAFEGLTPTDADTKAIAQNKIPPSLRYQNEADNVHLNEYGYDFLANCIYEQGKTLGYWK